MGAVVSAVEVVTHFHGVTLLSPYDSRERLQETTAAINVKTKRVLKMEGY